MSDFFLKWFLVVCGMIVGWVCVAVVGQQLRMAYNYFKARRHGVSDQTDVLKVYLYIETGDDGYGDLYISLKPLNGAEYREITFTDMFSVKSDGLVVESYLRKSRRWQKSSEGSPENY